MKRTTAYEVLGRLYWLGVASLLSVALSGWSPGFDLAIDLTTVYVIYIAVSERSIETGAARTGVLYLALLLLAQWEPAQALHWPAAGFAGAMALWQARLPRRSTPDLRPRRPLRAIPAGND